MLSLKWRLAQWLELRWWKNYLQEKDKQTYLVWKRNYWNELLQSITPYIVLTPHSTIVDLGCGPAGIFIALPENEVTAVDPLINAYEQQTSLFKKGDYPNVNFLNDTIENFKSPGINPKYDLVFCMNAINHVNDIQTAFQNLKTLCNKEGAVIVSIDAHRYQFFKILFRLIPGDMLHPHQYNLHEYEQLLAADDWQIITSIELKRDFFFAHYCMVAKRKMK